MNRKVIIIFVIVLVNILFYIYFSPDYAVKNFQPDISFGTIQCDSNRHIEVYAITENYPKRNNKPKFSTSLRGVIEKCEVLKVKEQSYFTFFRQGEQSQDSLFFRLTNNKLTYIFEGFKGRRPDYYLYENFDLEEVKKFKLQLDTTAQNVIKLRLSTTFNKFTQTGKFWNKTVYYNSDSLAGCIACEIIERVY